MARAAPRWLRSVTTAVASVALTAAGSVRGARAETLPTTHAVGYGVSLATETVLRAADVCPSTAREPCILGSGGGFAIRAGYRAREPWYVGGAYSVTRHDSSNLLRLAILQQLRAEARRYVPTGRRASPFFGAAAGAALYGNEFGTDTAGLALGAAVGLEVEITRSTVLVLGASLRSLLLRGWTDRAGQRRADGTFGFGLAHLAGLELGIEVRDPLPRW